MQTKRSMVSAEPAASVSKVPKTGPDGAAIPVFPNKVSAEPSASVSNKGRVPKTGPDGAAIPVFVRETKLGGFSRLASRPVFKGGFCRSHPCSMLAAGDKGHGLGSTATIDEEGYEEVAKLKDDGEMKTFIKRVIRDYDCRVDDESGLMGIVPWFSGTTGVQSLAKLEESLLFAVLANGKRWISYKNGARTTGAHAPLDLQGYMEVAIIRKHVEMEKFARRLAEHMGVKIIDEVGFKGMIKYHDGAAAFQSFDKLQQEIKSAAAAPDTWAKFKSI